MPSYVISAANAGNIARPEPFDAATIVCTLTPIVASAVTAASKSAPIGALTSAETLPGRLLRGLWPDKR